MTQAFSLALAFGEWDVRKLIREIPYDLFIYWSLFLSMEKTKKTKQDYQFALLTKVICEKDTKVNNNIDKYLIAFKSEEEILKERIEEEDRLFRMLSSRKDVSIYKE